MRKPRAIGIYLGDEIACAAWVAETGCTSMIANEEGLVLWPVRGEFSKTERLKAAIETAGADVMQDAIALVAPKMSSPGERAGWIAAAQEAGIGNVAFPTAGVCGAVGLLESLGALASASGLAVRTLTISADDGDETTVCGARANVLQVRDRRSKKVAEGELKPEDATASTAAADEFTSLPRDAFEAHWSGSSSNAPPEATPAAAPVKADYRIVVGEGTDPNELAEANQLPCHFHPLEAIARGGAHIANHTVQVFDLAACPLGVGVMEDDEHVWRPLVPAGSRLPARLVATFASATPEQSSLSIRLTYRGDDGEESLAGTLVIDGLPHQEGEAVEAEITLDLFVNGRIAVQAPSGQGRCHPTFMAAGTSPSDEAATCSADARLVSAGPPDSSPWDVFLPPEPEAAASTGMEQETSGTAPPAMDYLEARPQTFRRSQPAGLSPFKQTVIFFTGMIVSGVIGLAIGYYILVWMRPEANVLELDLPGLGGRTFSRP